MYGIRPAIIQTYGFNPTDSRSAYYWCLSQTPAPSQSRAVPAQAQPLQHWHTGLGTHLPHLPCLWVFELKQRVKKNKFQGQPMLSWKNTKCREQQTQSITITTPAVGDESMNCFGLLPACSPTWENTHSPENHDFIPSHSTLLSPSPKSSMESKSPRLLFWPETQQGRERGIEELHPRNELAPEEGSFSQHSAPYTPHPPNISSPPKLCPLCPHAHPSCWL